MINFSFYLFDDDEYFFSILKKRTHVFLDFFLSTLTHDTDTYMCVAEVRVVVASIASIYIVWENPIRVRRRRRRQIWRHLYPLS